MTTPTSLQSLFTPISIGKIDLKNRIVMAPLTRSRSGIARIPNDLNVEYYKQRASAGLIITEATLVSPDGAGYPFTPGIYNEDQIAGWKKVTSAVHEQGGKIMVQLWHCGRVSHSSLLPNGAHPRSASANVIDGDVLTLEGMQAYETPQAMTLAEIKQVIDDFKQAAINAKAAGFDGVQVHGANGYLLDQFLRDGTNQRTDQYGGSLENRARLLLEVVKTVCEVWGAEYTSVRLSPLQPFNGMFDSDPQTTFTYIINSLDEFDLAFLEVTKMGSEAPGAAGPYFDLSLLKPLWHGQYMLNNEYTAETANQAIESAEADLISFGKLFIANPDLPERFALSAPMNEPDPSTFYGGDKRGYTDYPFYQPPAI